LTVNNTTNDLRVLSFEPLPSPRDVIASVGESLVAQATVLKGREEVRQVLNGLNSRFLVICGPCSIHDPHSASEYAKRFAQLRAKVASKILLVMRVYFEKPRTTVGWKGLINDPHIDGTNDIVFGLSLARKVLVAINELEVPCATEFLDPIVPQYTSDLVSWAAIGARTTESQTHRQMASGLSMPVGFKNATDGSLQVALDAMVSARAPHAFVGIDQDGRTSIVRTKGNADVHLVLRGGHSKPNYSKADLAYTKGLLDEKGPRRLIVVDCSHGNSSKNFLQQPRVFQEVLEQFTKGDQGILGTMLESHLVEGKQSPVNKPLVYGQSVTDGCIGWEATEELLLDAFSKL
jgi:3-deoxy-7-phosphoheptulonate synthase